MPLALGQVNGGKSEEVEAQALLLATGEQLASEKAWHYNFKTVTFRKLAGRVITVIRVSLEMWILTPARGLSESWAAVAVPQPLYRWLSSTAEGQEKQLYFPKRRL